LRGRHHRDDAARAFAETIEVWRWIADAEHIQPIRMRPQRRQPPRRRAPRRVAEGRRVKALECENIDAHAGVRYQVSGVRETP
jgi:hypothetical protein